MNGIFTSNPSNAAEAKAVIEALPGGSAQFTEPSRDYSRLPMPPPPQPAPLLQQTQASSDTEQQTSNPGTAPSTAAAPVASGTTNGTSVNGGGRDASNGNGTLPNGIPLPTLQNIVASINVDCRLDLKTIALHARNAEYNPKRFSACVMRLRDPKSTALIFASGKMVVTGVKSEYDARLSARKFARILQRLGFNARFLNFKIHNVVATVDAKFPVHIARMQAVHHAFSSYEPGT